MPGRKTSHHHKKRKKEHIKAIADRDGHISPETVGKKRLEIVLKCDTSGCIEAVAASIQAIALPEVDMVIISSGVGAVNKSDIFMAETGSRLIVGFNVGVAPYIDRMVGEHNVEIRIFDVIYRLLEDLESIGKSFISQEPVEQIVGTAKVIKLFKSSRKGIILGCEVLSGKLMQGKAFRILGPMGSIYIGNIESLHIEKDKVREATKGQQVGLKIKDFNKVRIDYQVECFEPGKDQNKRTWSPRGTIFYP